ncbi:hypothetical protein Tco_1548485 [Tanacetum coccineum]
MAKASKEIVDAITEDEVDEKKNYTTKGIIFQTLPENVLLQVSKHKNAKDVWESIKKNDNESINDFAGNISGIVAKFKSLGLTLEEEVIVRKFLNSVPNKYLPIVAPIEQYSDLETKPFEEAVGRVKAYEASHQNEEEDVEGTQREVEEAEEEEEVMVTKVEFGAMIVESVGTLAMSAQSGKTKIKPT